MVALPSKREMFRSFDGPQLTDLNLVIGTVKHIGDIILVKAKCNKIFYIFGSSPEFVGRLSRFGHSIPPEKGRSCFG